MLANFTRALIIMIKIIMITIFYYCYLYSMCNTFVVLVKIMQY